MRRFILIALVFAMAAALAYIQNHFFVGEQELHATLREQGKGQYEIVFKDLAGNVVAASENELALVEKRLGASRQLKRIAHQPPQITAEGTVSLTISDASVDIAEVRSHLMQSGFQRSNPARDWFHVGLGIDLQGGVEFTCALYDDDGQRVPANDEVVSILRARLDARGLAEPQVFRMANGDIQVVIPGGSKADAARTRKVLESTGKLEFRELLGEYAGEPGRYIERVNGRWTWTSLARREGKGFVGRGEAIMPEKPPRGAEPTKFVHLGPVKLTGQDVQDAYRTLNEGQTAVGITFSVVGGAKNRAFTEDTKRKGDEGRGSGRIAISLDGFVESSPRIIEPSTRNCVITGNFTDEEVDSLRTVLKAGSLSVKPEITSQKVVGPSLGHETIMAGVTAMVWSLVTILGFILVYYWWRLGAIAVASLTTCIVLLFCAVSAFGATLTLPGLAGLVLTVGMAVDANILIFERIREEIAPDKDIASCIDAGYGRAFWTIFDANITTFLTAFVLYLIGSGPVKGFGLTLMIGIVTTIFAACYLGRALTDWLYRRQTTIRVVQRIPRANLPYYRLRWVGFAVSWVAMLGGLGYFFLGGPVSRNFDIDFTGGIMAQTTFAKPMELSDLRAAVAEVHAREGDRLGLLDPDNLQIQPYQSNLQDGGSATRQFVFKVRDPEASGIEREKNRLEIEQSTLRKAWERAQERGAPPSEVRALEDQVEALDQQVRPLREQLAERVETFKAQVEAAFGERIGAEGSEVLAASYDAGRLSVDLETLRLPDAAALTQVRLALDAHPFFDRAEVQTRENPMGVQVQVHLTQAAQSAPDVLAEGPVVQRLAALFGAQSTPALTTRGKELVAAIDGALATVGVSLAAPFPASDYFSPQVADQMKWRALAAVGASLLIILIYIAMRFELRYGVGAIIATVHDVLITFGLLAVFGIRIDLTVIAALLTIIGYSLNDTIVVFDRIREVVKQTGCKVLDAIDPAVAQTMSRTVLTSGTTLFSVLVLLVFGGEGVYAFSATMVLGLIFGTYSSVFIASPVLVWFRDPLPKPVEEARAEGEGKGEGELNPA